MPFSQNFQMSHRNMIWDCGASGVELGHQETAIGCVGAARSGTF
jgi:hypothetical protein